jgi:cytochrome P450
MIEHEDNKPESGNVSESLNDEIKTKAVWNGPLKKTLTNSEILSQAILFLIAGYETTANTIEFVAYHLAKYQNVQDKLIEEIDLALEQHV